MSTTTSSIVTLQDNAGTPVDTDVTKSQIGNDSVTRTSDDGEFKLTHRSTKTRAGRNRKIVALRKDYQDAEGNNRSVSVSMTLDFESSEDAAMNEVGYMLTRFLSVNSYTELGILRAGHYYG